MTLTKIGNNLLLKTKEGRPLVKSVDAYDVVRFINRNKVKEVNGIDNLPACYRSMIQI